MRTKIERRIRARLILLYVAGCVLLKYNNCSVVINNHRSGKFASVLLYFIVNCTELAEQLEPIFAIWLLLYLRQ